MSHAQTFSITGEASHQPAIRRCKPGEPVEIVHEHFNSSDKKALAVMSVRGERIGYIGRKSWLRDAIHNEQREVEARIISVARGERGLMAVTLILAMDGANLDDVVAFEPEAPRGFLARLFRR